MIGNNICKILKVVNSSLKKNLSRLSEPQARDQRTVFMLWPHGGALGAGKQASQDLQEGQRPPCPGLLLNVAVWSVLSVRL